MEQIFKQAPDTVCTYEEQKSVQSSTSKRFLFLLLFFFFWKCWYMYVRLTPKMFQKNHEKVGISGLPFYYLFIYVFIYYSFINYFISALLCRQS